MFRSLLKLTEDMAKIVLAPVEIAVDLTRCVTKPMADAAQGIKDDVKEMTED